MDMAAYTTKSNMYLPRLYLGTMTFGWKGQTSHDVDEAVALQMTQRFIQFNQKRHEEWDGSQKNDTFVHHIDTARIYASGKTEYICGSILQKLGMATSADGFGEKKQDIISIGTKAHPTAHPMGLSNIAMNTQLETSLEALGVSSPIGEYYLHQPDVNHPLSESLQCAHEMVVKGLISSIGLSNYHASEVQRAFDLCERNNWTKPTVYQGLYNPLNRMVEEELLPVLRQNHCSFIAYNPLAGGLLTGKYRSTNHVDQSTTTSVTSLVDAGTVPEGRFRNNPNYLSL